MTTHIKFTDLILLVAAIQFACLIISSLLVFGFLKIRRTIKHKRMLKALAEITHIAEDEGIYD